MTDVQTKIKEISEYVTCRVHLQQ